MSQDPYLRSAYYGAFQAQQRMGDREAARALIEDYQRLDANPRSRLAEFKYTRMGPKAEALAVGPAGNIYVLDRGAGRIEMFDRAGKRLTAVGPSLPGGLELERPADLTVDLAGRLWIADSRLGLVVLE